MTPDLQALIELSAKAIQGEWEIGKIESDGARIDCGDWEQIAYLWQTTRRYVPGDNLDATGPEFGVENPQANGEFICALVNWFRANHSTLTAPTLPGAGGGDALDAARYRWLRDKSRDAGLWDALGATFLCSALDEAVDSYIADDVPPQQGG